MGNEWSFPTWLLTFWCKPVSIFGLSSITTFISSSLSLTMLLNSSELICRDAGRSFALSHRLQTPSLPTTLAVVEADWQNNRRCLVKTSIAATYTTFVSHQINGREGETATFLKSSSVNPLLARGGFAPRHLKRGRLLLVHKR